MIKVVLFRFDYKNCPGSDMKTDMEIIPVKNTSPVVEVGAQLENFVATIKSISSGSGNTASSIKTKVAERLFHLFYYLS